MSIYDAIDLKDQIKNHRRKLEELKKENDSLQQDIESYTKQTTNLRKEYNNIEHHEVLKIYKSSDDSSLTQVESISEIFDNNVSYIEMNAKMELKILNDNMKANLPKLQELARNHEGEAWKTEDQMKLKLSNQIQSSFINQSLEDLKQDINDYLTKKSALQSTIIQEINQLKSQQSQVSKTIAVIRRDISDLVNEREDYKQAMLRFRSSVIEEEAKFDYLLQHHEDLKASIGKYYQDKDGWMTEAFLNETKGNNMEERIDCDRLIQAVSIWFPEEEFTRDSLDDYLASCPYPYPKQPQDINYDHFIVLMKLIERNRKS